MNYEKNKNIDLTIHLQNHLFFGKIKKLQNNKFINGNQKKLKN